MPPGSSSMTLTAGAFDASRKSRAFLGLSPISRPLSPGFGVVPYRGKPVPETMEVEEDGGDGSSVTGG
jgi:hypothetical protein